MNTGSEAAKIDMKLEVVIIPVSDIDRAKDFYTGLGWRLDADFSDGESFRGVQVTPPGSGCSVIFGKGITQDDSGLLAKGLYLVVSDIEAARAELIRRGVAVSDLFHGFALKERGEGPDPERRSYYTFASFNDPDGNSWLLQEVKERLPGRVAA